MTLRITASHPFYREISRAWEAYAQAQNSHVWFNLKDIPQEFLLTLQEDLLKEMKRLIELDEK